MYQIQTAKEPERALLVGVRISGITRMAAEESLEELASLADTAGAVVVEKIVQELRTLNSGTLIGSGKVQQIARRVIELDVKLVIFDEDLSPVQLKNLEKIINRKVLDRSGLILDIFALRARTREAQTQVELAQLQYLLPRLTRAWTHLSRQVGGIGTKGPGETQLEVDRRLVRKRIERLKEDLRKIELQRSVRRKQRDAFKKVALVGYTNAGKSSLLNALSNAGVFVEDRLFATLDATIRVCKLHENLDVLLIDTVGFIRKLPHDLVASFRSTLEETIEADCLLHVVDVAHPRFEEHFISVQTVLRDMKIHEKPALIVFNKIDALEDRRILPQLQQRYGDCVFTSASKGMGLQQLRKRLAELLQHGETEAEIRIPASNARLLSKIYRLTHVVEKRYDEDVAVLRIRTVQDRIRQIEEMTEGLLTDEHSDH